jgi:hypothetical protein
VKVKLLELRVLNPETQASLSFYLGYDTKVFAQTKGRKVTVVRPDRSPWNFENSEM